MVIEQETKDSYAEHKTLLDQIPEGEYRLFTIPKTEYRPFAQAIREAAFQTQRQATIRYKRGKVRIGWKVAIEVETQLNTEPAVLRDERGRIRWTLPGNTMDRNLLIGVRNVQALFLEKFPEFALLFPRGEDGKIPDSQTEEARSFVLDKIGSQKRYTQVIGGIGMNRATAPYFEGSYRVIIEKTFGEWGIISSDKPKIDRKTGVYVDQKGQTWISIKHLSEKFGVDYSTVQKYTKDAPSIMGLSTGGRIITLYNKEEAGRKLQQFISLPQADKQTRIYTDNDGDMWIGANELRRRVGVDLDVLIKHLAGIRSQNGRNHLGQSVILYNLAEADYQLAEFLNYPKVEKGAKKYTDADGNSWVIPQYLKDIYGIAQSTLVSHLKNVSSIICKNQIGQPSRFYNEAEIKQKINTLLSLPKIDSTTGIFTDDQGINWIDLLSASKKARIEYITLAKYIKNKEVSIIQGRRGFVQIKLYEQEDLDRYIQAYLHLPQVDKNNRFSDKEGASWVTAASLANEFGLSYSTLLGILKEVSVIDGRQGPVRESKLFLEEQARKLIQYFLSLPQIDKKTGVYIDGKGGFWVTASFLLEKFGVNADMLLVASGNFVSIQGRSAANRQVVLYYQEAVLDYFKSSLELPKANRKTGIYVDDQKEIWAPLKTLAKRVELSEGLVTKYLIEARSIKGRSSTGQETILFSETDLLIRLKGDHTLPRVDKQSGRYVDQASKSWVSITTLAKENGFAPRTLMLRINQIPTIRGRDKGGHLVLLVAESEALEQLNYLKSLPKVDEESKIFQDENKENWVTIYYLHTMLGIDYATVKRLIEGVRSIEGRWANGRIGVLYNQKETQGRIEPYLKLPQVDKDNNKHFDQQGEGWISIGSLHDKYNIAVGVIARYTADVRSIQGRNRNGLEVTLYNEIELERNLQDFLSLPQVDKQTVVFVDPENKTWAPVVYFHKKLGIDYRTIAAYLEGVDHIRGKDKGGKETVLYSETQLKDKLNPYATLPKVDKSGKYTDKDGITWVTVKFFDNSLGVRREWLTDYLQDLHSIRGRDRVGNEAILYNEAEVMDVIKHKDLLKKAESVKAKNLGEISSDIANEQLKRLLE